MAGDMTEGGTTGAIVRFSLPMMGGALLQQLYNVVDTLIVSHFIGAGALVPEGMVIPDGSVAVGVPAKIIKTIRPDQAAHNIENAVHYVGDAEAHAEAVKQCEIIETEAKTK